MQFTEQTHFGQILVGVHREISHRALTRRAINNFDQSWWNSSVRWKQTKWNCQLSQMNSAVSRTAVDVGRLCKVTSAELCCHFELHRVGKQKLHPHIYRDRPRLVCTSTARSNANILSSSYHIGTIFNKVTSAQINGKAEHDDDKSAEKAFHQLSDPITTFLQCWQRVKWKKVNVGRKAMMTN